MAVPQNNTLFVTTLQLVRPRLTDNIFRANGVLAYMLANGRVMVSRGGRYIQETLMYATNQTVQAYRGYDRLNVAPTEELTDAQYNYRLYAVSMGISGEEQLLNSGQAAKFNMLDAKIRVAEKSIRQVLNDEITGNGSSKDLNKQILGLDEFYDDTTSWSTIGGINSNTYSFWRNQLAYNGDGTGTGTSSSPYQVAAASTTQLTKALNRVYHNCAKGTPDQPDVILTDQTTYERYENDAVDKLRLTNVSMANMGFENIMFKNATMMWSDTLSDKGTGFSPVYFINTDYLSFTLHPDRNFKMSGFRSPIDQDAEIAQILFAGQMTCSNRRRLGIIWNQYL